MPLYYCDLLCLRYGLFVDYLCVVCYCYLLGVAVGEFGVPVGVCIDILW